MRTHRPILAIAAAAITLTAITPAAAYAAEPTIADVPWSQVGPGWTLATWSPVTPRMPGVETPPGEPTWETAAVTVYLVDPAGNRYALRTFQPGERADLLGWSGDGSHALFGDQYPAPDTVTVLDLHTGAEHTVDVGGYPRFTRPDGTALLMATDGDDNKTPTLKRIDLDGNLQFTYPTENLSGAGDFTGSHVESPDGTQLVLGTDNGLVAMRNDGTAVRALAKPPMWGAQCRPVRWWTTDEVLAHCDVDRSSATQLWTVPLDGSAATPLTALNSGQGDDPGFDGDYGDGTAWHVAGGTFLQSAGACGTMFLSKLTADGHTTRVNVPNMGHSIEVAGTSGDTLELLGKVGCGGTDSLVRYDPSANTSTVLLGPPVNGGGVTGAIPYPGGA
ncbi:hypothetical protein [Mycobacterium sp. 1274761.0]|uniref:hypothetical protein n=1 Tax=Mycobacterium sp. 1274761.0 TaxID=1834077 RepID=UPI000801D15E|nr:hypothetical protein [Mycobacterium sp. 1274761.0]OBK74675.1 hypothetical protein A5651_09400 [Mycobacterium sp. 1274761.0]